MKGVYMGQLEPGIYDLGDIGTLEVQRTVFGDLDIRICFAEYDALETDDGLLNDYVPTGDKGLFIGITRTWDEKLLDMDIHLDRM